MKQVDGVLRYSRKLLNATVHHSKINNTEQRKKKKSTASYEPVIIVNISFSLGGQIDFLRSSQGYLSSSLICSSCNFLLPLQQRLGLDGKEKVK